MKTAAWLLFLTACFYSIGLLLGFQNEAIVVSERDLAPGTVIQRGDVMTLVVTWRQGLPRGAFHCWLDCRDKVIEHKVVRAIEKYEPLTESDID